MCRCSNCALNHLQYAVDCLCCKEVQKCVESLKVLLSRAKPRTWHNNRMWNNAPGIQCCLNRWSLKSDAAKYNAIDGRNCSENFSAFLWTLIQSCWHSKFLHCLLPIYWPVLIHNCGKDYNIPHLCTTGLRIIIKLWWKHVWLHFERNEQTLIFI